MFVVMHCMFVQVAELYIDLACQHEPEAVLPFLQSHDSYDVSHVLRLCQQHGHVAGQVCALNHFRYSCHQFQAAAQAFVMLTMQAGPASQGGLPFEHPCRVISPRWACCEIAAPGSAAPQMCNVLEALCLDS